MATRELSGKPDEIIGEWGLASGGSGILCQSIVILMVIRMVTSCYRYQRKPYKILAVPPLTARTLLIPRFLARLRCSNT